jgi:hypothetical protein
MVNDVCGQNTFEFQLLCLHLMMVDDVPYEKSARAIFLYILAVEQGIVQ